MSPFFILKYYYIPSLKKVREHLFLLRFDFS